MKKITEGKGVDVIFDQIGASVWENNLKSLKMKGRILLVGVVGGGQTTFNFGPVIVRDLSVLGVTVFNAPRSNLINVINLVSLGRLKPVIDKRLPLSEAAAAQKRSKKPKRPATLHPSTTRRATLASDPQNA